MSPFRYRIFRHIWIASLASNFGGLIQSVGAAWLMTSIGSSPTIVALVQTSTTLPIMLFSLAAGAISDNFDRRKLMLLAQGFMMSVSIALAFFSYFGLVTPPLLLVFTFLMGCGTALNGPAWQSLVGEMVERPDIPAAVAWNSVGFNIARSVGPAIGGAIVAAFGAFAAFVVNSFTYIGLLTVLLRWRPATPPRTLPPESLFTAMGAGVRYVAMSPQIGVILLRGCIFGTCGISVQALMPLIARDLVGGGPVTFGLLLGGLGAGAVAGAFIATRLRQQGSVELTVRIAFLGTALGTALAGLSTNLAMSMAAMVVCGACWVMALSSFNSAVQLSAPRWVVGRAVALYQMCTFGGMALGSWAWGAVADSLGTGQALLVSAGTVFAGAVLGLRFAIQQDMALNLDPREWNAPDVALDIRQRSGPIVVTIEYIIREEDVGDFLAVMAERRRIRRRDGARHWTLLRDLAEPGVWIERYHSPTWLEYQRHNLRMTKADIGVGQRLRALHQGSEAPRVRRMIERQTTWPEADDLHPRSIAPPLTDPGGGH